MRWRSRTPEARERAYRRRVLHLLTIIKQNQERIMANTDALTAAVAANTTETAAAVAALGTIGPDPQPAIDSAVTQVEANTAALAAVVPAPPAAPAE